MSGRVRIPVNRFPDPNLRDALLKLENAVNENAARFSGILVHSLNQNAPPTIPSSVVSSALYTMTPAAVSLTAGAVGTALTASPGDHVHYLDTGAGSGLDAREREPGQFIGAADDDQPHRKYPRIMIATISP